MFELRAFLLSERFLTFLWELQYTIILMAFMTSQEETESQNDEQKHKKARRGCCMYCSSCCFCCTEFLSGLILLLLIAGLVLCARIFLEFPVILNGFGRTFNFTSQAASVVSQSSSITLTGIVGSAPSYGQSFGNTYHAHCNSNTYSVFMGSFQLVNETYLTQYNDSASIPFQEKAKQIETMLYRLFNRSLITAYKNASAFSLSPDPFTVHAQMLFCNTSATEYGINVNNVSKVLTSFTGTLDGINITMDTGSVVIGGEVPCPSSLGLNRMWPWQATIQESQTSFCMGSLLAAFWVLAPASCVSQRDPSHLSITLGATTVRKVTNVIIHPNYTSSPITNNVALILLSTPVLFSTTILPICLPSTTQDPTVGTSCSLKSGDSSTALSTGDLMTIAGTVTSGLACLGTAQDGITYISPTFSTTSIIQVDVGSSLVGMNTKNMVFLEGIASFQQKSTNLSSACLNYTSIGPATEWIKSYVMK
uniref:Peptidase S1 domain-containing protein n=1 Tax=Leptobrachium leishanense TaxID=445787 RepID=A0A8C5PWG4_9ANUR